MARKCNRRNIRIVRVVGFEGGVVVCIVSDQWRRRVKRISKFRHLDTTRDVDFVGQIDVSCAAQAENNGSNLIDT